MFFFFFWFSGLNNHYIVTEILRSNEKENGFHVIPGNQGCIAHKCIPTDLTKDFIGLPN